MVKCGIVIDTMSFIHAHKSMNNENCLFTVVMHNRECSEMHLVADQYGGLSIDTGAGSGISSEDGTCHQELE